MDRATIISLVILFLLLLIGFISMIVWIASVGKTATSLTTKLKALTSSLSSNTTDTWHDATLANGWQRFNNAYGGPQYTKDAQGFVHLRGLVSGSNSTKNTIFQLPAGYGPTNLTDGGYLIFISDGSGAAAEIRIDPTGNVIYYSGNKTWLSLDGITFPAF
jgi:hypothetical protein